jgi:hypothetical protein
MSNANGTKMDKAGKRQKFLDVFPILREELVDYVKSTGSPEEVWGWFEKVSCPYQVKLHKANGQSLNYNVPGGMSIPLFMGVGLTERKIEPRIISL